MLNLGSVIPRFKQRAEGEARPETRFQNRRGVFVVLIILGVLVFCGWNLTRCAQPMDGADKVLSGSGGVTSTPKPGVVPLNSVGGEIPTPRVVAVQVTATRVPSVISCRMNSDFRQGGVFLPTLTKVMVSGFSFAKGGLVEVSGAGWIPQSQVACDGDVAVLEKQYLETVTSTVTPLPSVTPTRPRIVVSVPTVQPTYTPYPTPAPIDVNGMWFDVRGCLVVAVWNVREIYVNREPATGGQTYCDVREIRVVVK